MLPLQDAFAVLFFVSVGMLFDPTILVREPLSVLVVLAIIVVGKSLAAFAIVAVSGYPITTALTVSASLAQIGEFSFILAGLGLSLGLLPAQGKDLILAGALLSITLNPLVFVAVDRLGARFARKARARATAKAAGVPPPPVAATAGGEPFLNHAVIVGFGRVGEAVGRALAAWDLPHVVVELDWRRAEEVRGRGVSVVYGDAAMPGILAAAAIARARLLVITVANRYQALRILELARGDNPAIEAVIRTPYEAEVEHLERAGASLVVCAEREVALGVMTYALRRMGLSEGETRMFVQSSRRPEDTGMAPSAEPHDAAPELRPHRADPP